MSKIGLVGFGKSNKALCNHFLNMGFSVCVHNEKKCDVPAGVSIKHGSDYLVCDEEYIFTSPAIRKDKILTHSPIFSEIEYSLSCLSCPKICITGSDGKTTTSTLINHVLKKGGYNTFLGGNIGNVLFDGIGKTLDFAVVELSSFQLHDYYPYSDCAIITNVTENHLDWHRDMNEYIKAKSNILKNAKRKIVCYDNEISRKIGMDYEDTVFYSINDISSDCKECFYVKDGYFLHNKQRLFKCDKVLLRGDFNLLNILASLCATCIIVDTATQELAVNSFSGVSGRLEFVKIINDVSFFSSSIDTTPSRTISTLSAFDKKKTVAILGGYDKNLSYDILKDSLASLKCAIVLGENKDKIASALSKTRLIVVNTLSEAVLTAFKLCKSGDSVVLTPASASFDMFKSYLERDAEFKKIVNTLH